MKQKRRIDMVMDRLSNLPEDMIHEIMSFLSPAEAARLSFDVYLCDTGVRYYYRSTLITASNAVTELLEYLVNFAIGKKITDLIIRCNGDYRQYGMENVLVGEIKRSCFLNTMFSAKTIKSLKLCGLVFGGFEDLILGCPLIEDFYLDVCTGLKSVEVSSCAKLMKEISIHNCYGLERIHVDGEVTSLESFSYTGTIKQYDHEMIDIDFASRKSLKFVELRRLKITDEWFRNNVSEIELLNTLILEDCQTMKNICINNEHLECLELKNCIPLESVDVLVPGLEYFEYVGRLNYGGRHCRIDINGSKQLKNLILSGAGVTERIEFSSCLRLPSMEIESPNLVEFRYSGMLVSSPPALLISSKLKIVVVEIYFEQLDNKAQGLHKFFMEFLSCFAYCNTINIKFGYLTGECFLYPEQVRKTLIPPLYGGKHLEIQVSAVRSDGILELVDVLLWLAPHPETISFLVGHIFPKTTKPLINFYYGVPANSEDKEEEDNRTACCSLSPVKCWRQDTAEVAIENFEDCVKTSLQSYFIRNDDSISYGNRVMQGTAPKRAGMGDNNWVINSPISTQAPQKIQFSCPRSTAATLDAPKTCFASWIGLTKVITDHDYRNCKLVLLYIGRDVNRAMSVQSMID
ncbi:hypothetical protein L484_025536 [Morus notabilis]|uniref:F-box domain-containing protein n=1 Tax=Morus notabilis TaxID=981085 RepID=W9RP54_9ROSA|nr:hypothetical protein L484_025536 [Morus notabilis]